MVTPSCAREDVNVEQAANQNHGDSEYPTSIRK